MSLWDFVMFILVVFGLVACLVVLFWILGDVITDPAMSGWAKAAWLLALLVLPLLGSVVYLVVRGTGMADRRAGTTSPGATADTMLASGAITGREHATLRSRTGR